MSRAPEGVDTYEGQLCGRTEGSMAEFVMWLKLTEKGLPRMEDAPAFLHELEKACELFGGQAKAYLVTGEHDFLVVGTVPSEDKLMHFAVGVSLTGEVTTTTMRAYSREYLDQTPIEKGGALHFPLLD